MLWVVGVVVAAIIPVQKTPKGKLFLTPSNGKKGWKTFKTPTLMTLLNQSKSQYADDNGRSVTKILTKHVDLCLRSAKTLAMPSSSIGSSDYLDMEILESIMSVFRLFQSKDIFDAFFKCDLAKSLHLNRSASIGLERSLILMLKTECGVEYTSEMSEMEIWN